MKKAGALILFCIFLACSTVQTGSEVKNLQKVTFFTFGDWGTGDENQKAVAQALRDYCAVHVCDFGVLLGDNFYENGVTSTDDPLWQSYFESVYLGLDLPFYVALGNHDYGGNIQAQLDYTQLQDRWILPDRNYQIIPSEAQGTPPLLEIFVVDSNQFSDGDAQLLSVALDDSLAIWKIVAFHHPVYSNGSHGDTEDLKTKIRPVLCNRADLILSGHDHIFSHLVDPNDACSFHQIVAGTGGRFLHSIQEDSRATFSAAAFGFGSLQVSEKEILIQFHQSDGSIPYEFLLQKGDI